MRNQSKICPGGKIPGDRPEWEGGKSKKQMSYDFKDPIEMSQRDRRRYSDPTI